MNAELRAGSSWEPCALTWRYSDARAALAAALGQLAADVWLRGSAALTTDHVVATVTVDAEAGTPDQDGDDQAAGDGSGRQEVA